MEKGHLRADVNVSVRRAGRRARHPLRDQEPQFDPLHRSGDRARGAAADRHHRGRRHDRAGDAAVRSGQRRDALDALEGRGARLPLFPRSGSAAARTGAVAGRGSARRACRNCRTRRRRALCATTRFPATTPTCSSPNATTADYFEACRGADRARDAKARGQLGDQRACSGGSTRKARTSRPRR